MPLSNVTQADLDALAEQFKGYDLPTILDLIRSLGGTVPDVSGGSGGDNSEQTPAPEPDEAGDGETAPPPPPPALLPDQDFKINSGAPGASPSLYPNEKSNELNWLNQAEQDLKGKLGAGDITQQQYDDAYGTYIQPDQTRQTEMWDTSNILFNKMKDLGLDPKDFGFRGSGFNAGEAGDNPYYNPGAPNYDASLDYLPPQDPNFLSGPLKDQFDLLRNRSNATGQSQFGEAGANSIWDSLTQRYQGENKAKANTAFGNGFAYNALPDTLDDDLISRLVDEQYNPAFEQVDRAYKRGQLNDKGYGLAKTKLDNTRSTVSSRLQGVGGSYLSSVRNQLQGIGDKALGDAGNFQLGDRFDLSGYQRQYDDVKSRGIADLEGSIRGSLTNDEFNVADILGYGRSNQGISNNNAASITQTLAARKKKKNEATGLGTQGAF